MPRVKRGVTAKARHKKVLEQAKGFRGHLRALREGDKADVDVAGIIGFLDADVLGLLDLDVSGGGVTDVVLVEERAMRAGPLVNR